MITQSGDPDRVDYWYYKHGLGTPLSTAKILSWSEVTGYLSSGYWHELSKDPDLALDEGL